jgi:hypothetical protein
MDERVRARPYKYVLPNIVVYNCIDLNGLAHSLVPRHPTFRVQHSFVRHLAFTVRQSNVFISDGPHYFTHFVQVTVHNYNSAGSVILWPEVGKRLGCRSVGSGLLSSIFRATGSLVGRPNFKSAGSSNLEIGICGNFAAYCDCTGSPKLILILRQCAYDLHILFPEVLDCNSESGRTLRQHNQVSGLSR